MNAESMDNDNEQAETRRLNWERCLDSGIRLIFINKNNNNKHDFQLEMYRNGFP